MNKLQAGFCRVNVTPPLGIPIVGYYKPRFAEGVLDELEVNALALCVEDKKVILLSVDNCGFSEPVANSYREHICEVTGLPADCVFLHATHTHTGPSTCPTYKEDLVLVAEYENNPLLPEYFYYLRRKLADAAVMALNDLKPARMGWAVGNAPKVAFVRRFRMKDGKVRTNPGVGNPDILYPIGDVDERVNVLRFDRADDSLVLVNIGNHPDAVGDSLISGDWPTLRRHRLETALDNVKSIFFNGAQGDVNHVNVNAKGGDFNDTFHDFDDVDRGYGHARHMGNVVAAAVLQVFDKVNYTDVESLRTLEKTFQIPSAMPTPEEAKQAHIINDLHLSGRDEELPYEGMELTTVVAEAARMVRLEHGPVSFPMNFVGVAIGSVALFGIPGEPFTGVGRGLKEAAGWDLVLPCCLTNGCRGYFPMMDAYEEGGYEARSSSFKAGSAELIVEEGCKLLDELRG